MHPFHGAGRVEQGFSGRESFGRNGDNCLVRIHVLYRLGQGSTVNIGNDFHVITRAITAKRVDEQFRTKRRAANADMQYMADIAHQPCINGLNQSAHTLLKRMGISNRVRIACATLCAMLCCTSFGDIDGCARKQSRLSGIKLHIRSKLYEMS